MKLTTTDPHPFDLEEEILGELGRARIDILRIARRPNTRPTPERPTPEATRWIAVTAAGCSRVNGVKHRRFLAERLRYVLKIDSTPPQPDGLRPDDIEWVEKIAAELALPILEQREEPTWSR